MRRAEALSSVQQNIEWAELEYGDVRQTELKNYALSCANFVVYIVKPKLVHQSALRDRIIIAFVFGCE